METGDFDGDGNLDVVINGNDYGSDASIGRYDALNGLMLKGDGKDGFKPLSILQSGIYIPGNGKALVKLRTLVLGSGLARDLGNAVIAAGRAANDAIWPTLRLKVRQALFVSLELFCDVYQVHGCLPIAVKRHSRMSLQEPNH